MGKQSLYGLLLIGAIFFGFIWYSSHQAKQFQEQQRIADSVRRAHGATAGTGNAADSTASFDNAAGKSATGVAAGNAGAGAASAGNAANVADTAAAARAQQAQFYGETLEAASHGEEKLFTVENNLAKFTFSNKGGRIASVELKKYKRFDGGPLVLFTPDSSAFSLTFFIMRDYKNVEVNTGNYYFTVDSLSSDSSGGGLAAGEKIRIVSMKLHVDRNAYVEFRYVIPRDNYMIGYSVRFVGMQGLLANQNELLVNWQAVSFHLEKNPRSEHLYSTIFYNYAAGDKNPDNIGISSSGSKSSDVNARLKWVAFKQQFFSSVIIAKGEFQNASLRFDSFQPESGKVKDFSAKLSVPFTADSISAGSPACDFSFYFGPNKFSLLRSYNMQLQKLVPLGGWIIGWINSLIVIPLFDFLGRFISSFGLIILLLTLFIKIITLPLTYKSYISQAKMRLVKPEIDELAKKYPKQEDALKKQQATMELYKRAGINPLGGCLPMLIQFPILIAMFRFFPASIELRGQSFLWAQDLSSYDSILNLPFSIPFYGSHVSLFALLMAVSVFISAKLNYNQTASTSPQMGGASMKFMTLYMMPVMMILWFNSYASGLSYYYLLFNILSIGQTYAFRYAIDEKKLHEKMRAKAASRKPRKKSKWRERYEEMLKEQQRQARKR